ncbi:MAG: MotA/TolQ/ExbB proton channel family protein [Leptospirales bacterium]
MTLFNFLSQVSPMAEAVLGVLLFLSALSWGIVFYKFYLVSKSVRENKQFIKAFKRTDRFSKLYQEAGEYRKSTLSFIFRAGYEKVLSLKDNLMVTGGRSSEMDLDVIHRTLIQASQEEQGRLESYLPVLATTANISPFVGLLGTVWGIIHAFRDISHQASASIASVAPGIADALVTTAAGLFTAIPAVIFYNYYLQKIRQIQSVADTFILEILNVVSEERWKD